MWVGVVTLLLGSLVVAEVGRRSRAGTLPRNPLVGLRVPATMTDDESWQVAHRAAGPVLIATGLVGAALAIAGGILGTTFGDDAAAATLLVAAVSLIGGALWSARRGLAALDRRG